MSDIDTAVVVSLKVLDPDGRLEKRTKTDASICLLCAISGSMHRSKNHRYSITSSERTSRVCGTMRLSVLALFRKK